LEREGDERGRRDVHTFCDLKSSFHLSWCDQEAMVRPCDDVRTVREGGSIARGALDEFPLFQRCANLACCDISEDVELWFKHRDPVGCRTHCGLSEGSDP